MDAEGRAWDFDDMDRRDAAWKVIKRDKPMLVVGSPMCTQFCLLLNISKEKRDPAIVAEKLRKARVHLSFCMEIYKYQLENGRQFLHEHPLTATSWEMPETMAIQGLPGVDRRTCHQCQYGAVSEGGDPIRKATR